MPGFCFSLMGMVLVLGSPERSLRGVRGDDRCAGASGVTPKRPERVASQPAGRAGSTVAMPIYTDLRETGLTLVCLRCGHGWLRRSLDKLPGTCPHCCSPYWNRPRKGLPALHKAPGLRPLTRTQGLQMAADLIHALRGYRKSTDYRTTQNDLNFVCEVLQRAAAGETNDIAKRE